MKSPLSDNEISQCPEFPFFGATYPDARCIDGFLWDLDSCDDDPNTFHNGGDAPCPFCNTESFIEMNIDLEHDDPKDNITRDDILKWIEKIKVRYGHNSKKV